MFTAMYDHVDELGKHYHLNAKINGFKHQASALRAILRKPSRTGMIQIGQQIVSIVVKGREIKADTLSPV